MPKNILLYASRPKSKFDLWSRRCNFKIFLTFWGETINSQFFPGGQKLNIRASIRNEWVHVSRTKIKQIYTVNSNFAIPIGSFLSGHLVSAIQKCIIYILRHCIFPNKVGVWRRQYFFSMSFTKFNEFFNDNILLKRTELEREW